MLIRHLVEHEYVNHGTGKKLIMIRDNNNNQTQTSILYIIICLTKMSGTFSVVLDI